MERLTGVPLAEIVCSPLLRCEQTVEPLAKDRDLVPVSEPELAEVDYGQWTGGSLKTLAKEPLWKVVQAHPSAAVFPDGEGLAGMQARAVAAVRRHDARIAEAHGPHTVWLACSHGDVIKAVLADALATHLDNFQRIMVDTCSISVVHYTPTRPFVARVNDLGGDVAGLIPPKPRRRRKAAPPQLRRRGGRKHVTAMCRSARGGLLWISPCPVSFTFFVSPSASSRAPSASPVTDPSTCRPSRIPAR